MFSKSASLELDNLWITYWRTRIMNYDIVSQLSSALVRRSLVGRRKFRIFEDPTKLNLNAKPIWIVFVLAEWVEIENYFFINFKNMHLALFGFWSRLERKSIQNLVSFSELFFCTATLQSTYESYSSGAGINRLRYSQGEIWWTRGHG